MHMNFLHKTLFLIFRGNDPFSIEYHMIYMNNHRKYDSKVVCTRNNTTMFPTLLNEYCQCKYFRIVTLYVPPSIFTSVESEKLYSVWFSNTLEPNCNIKRQTMQIAIHKVHYSKSRLYVLVGLIA